MECDYCQIVAGKDNPSIIYEDEQLIAYIADRAYTPGQITIIPKEHFTILEQLPKQTFAKMATLANMIAVSLFDGLQAHGTNILVENGLGAGQSIPHFAMQVIPRVQEDKLSLEWQPLDLEDYDLEDAFIQLSSLTEGLTIEDHDHEQITAQSGDTEVVLDKTDASQTSTKKKGKKTDNYLLKSLRRRA